MNATNAAERTHQSSWFDHAVRAGLVAYGLVHLLIGWLALQLALGDREGKASSTGALKQLAEQPLGGVLVWAVAVGLALLVVWRLLETFFGFEEEQDSGKKLRRRATSALKAVLYGALAVSAVRVAMGDSSSGGGTDSTTAKLMDLPAGQWIVVLAGLAVIGYGISLIVRGWTEKFTEHLDTQGQSGKTGSAYVKFGKVGYIAKGLSIMIVGGFLAYAGITHDPDKSAGLDQALHKVLEQPFGQGLLIALALGIICYGLFCFARAKHLDR